MISLIVAMSKTRVIGSNGKIPWSIKGEQKRFKELTTGNVVIMGRRTYEDIGQPLPNRINVVISSNSNYNNIYNFKTLEEAINYFNDKEIFIIGGERLYEEALSYVDRMYITEVDKYVEGDTYFPEFNINDFDIISREYVYEIIPYCYVTYNRKVKNKVLKRN